MGHHSRGVRPPGLHLTVGAVLAAVAGFVFVGIGGAAEGGEPPTVAAPAAPVADVVGPPSAAPTTAPASGPRA